MAGKGGKAYYTPPSLSLVQEASLTGFIDFQERNLVVPGGVPNFVRGGDIVVLREWFEERDALVVEAVSGRWSSLSDLVDVLKGPLQMPPWSGDSVDAVLDFIPEILESRPKPAAVVIRSFSALAANDLHLAAQVVYGGLMISDELGSNGQQLTLFFCEE